MKSLTKNIIGTFSVLFLLSIVTVYFVSDVFSLKWTHFRYCFFLLFLVSVALTFYKKDNNLFCKQFLIFAITGLSVPILFNLSKNLDVLGSFVWDEMATGLGIVLLFLVLRVLLDLVISGHNNFKAVLCTGLELLMLCPYFLSIMYYVVIGDVVDVNSLIALYQTNYKEALEFISDSVDVFLLIPVTIVLFVWLVFHFKLNKNVVIENDALGSKIKIGLLIFVSILSVILFSKVSNSTYFNRIIYESLDYVKSVNEYRQHRIDADGNFKKIELNANFNSIPEDAVCLVIIGESQNRNHMGVYGYERNTTPWLDKKKANGEFLFMNNGFACHTLTMKSLSNVLTESNQYNDKRFANSYSLVDVAKAAGFETYWISNQGKFGDFSSPISVMASMADHQVWLNPDDRTGNVYDEEIVKNLSVVSKDKTRKVVFIHLMGNHWEYGNRYPVDFKVPFTAADAIYAKAKNGAKLNEYDTSILYNDGIVQKIFEYAEANWNLYNMLYFADHGEAVLSDRKHIPSSFEKDMVEIPVYFYFSNDYKKNNWGKYQYIKDNIDVFFTNDLIFNSMLGIWGIKSSLYNSQHDFLSDDYVLKQRDLKSLDGKINLF